MELAPLIRDKPRLSEFLKDIPNDPGCYLMKDSEDRLLYVGKSKKLRNRVNEVGILEETVIVGLRDVRFSDRTPYFCVVGH